MLIKTPPVDEPVQADDHVPCWSRHPGLCITRDTDFLPVVLHICAGLDSYFAGRSRDILIGEICKLTFIGESGKVLCVYGMLGEIRLARPKYQVFAMCALSMTGTMTLATISTTGSGEHSLLSLHCEFNYAWVLASLRQLGEGVRSVTACSVEAGVRAIISHH